MAKPQLEVFIGADTKGFNKGLKEVESKAKSFEKNIESGTKTTNNFGSALTKVGGLVAGAFAIDALISFGGAVINTTAEFQKFEAVLTNTLGSKSQAQRAMANIVDFASRTPFAVNELTESFVKLANQGFKPSMDELRKLGDLAASTGKGFDQLTEAIIDAQTGEFERLKEFGIRASKEGDRVTFTFKGVKQQVDFTAEAMREYVLSLGDAAGVSGSMAAISETLGGKISNLGDNWSQFMLALGGQSNGVLYGTINALNEMLGIVNDFLVTTEKETFVNQRLIETGVERIKSYKEMGLSASEATKKLEEVVNQEWEVINAGREMAETYTSASQEVDKNTESLDAFIKRMKLVEEQMKRQESLSILNERFGANINTDITGLAPQEQEIGAIEGVNFDEILAASDATYQLGENALLAATNWNQLTLATQQQMEQMAQLEAVFSSVFEDLFTNLMTGETSFKDFGKTAIKAITGVIAKLLAQAIASAIAGEASKGLVGIVTGSIAAGGIAALFKSQVGSANTFADGGIAYGPTFGLMGEYSNARSNPEVIAPLDKLEGMMGNMGMGQLTARVQGRDLFFVLQQESGFRNRTS